MKQVPLGQSGLEVSALGLGCMVIAGFYGPGSAEEAIRVIHHARDIGVTFLDSSDAYGAGKNEELLAQAIKGQRDDYVAVRRFMARGQRTELDGKWRRRRNVLYAQRGHYLVRCSRNRKRVITCCRGLLGSVPLHKQRRLRSPHLTQAPLQDRLLTLPRMLTQGTV